MSQFKITWKATVYGTTIVEAESMDEARDKAMDDPAADLSWTDDKEYPEGWEPVCITKLDGVFEGRPEEF